MKQILCLLFCMFLSLTVSAQKKTADLSGKWEFNATDVPYGYEKGNIEFKTEKDKLNIIFDISGSKIVIDQIEKNGDTYKCSFEVDGSDVEIVFVQKAEKLEANTKVDGTPVGMKLKKLE
ncbi:hypothetical protein [uncultured Parabacteroides sp.]|uniref:hypothetical protein n=1 Tax=uncultured Parabacteroides sp. TaxID=512312 RepID=UPI00259BCF47|nr:hypothetical protein [uncultured Parabacteroides sp.]